MRTGRIALFTAATLVLTCSVAQAQVATATLKGRKPTSEAKAAQRRGMLGHSVSSETRAKISAAHQHPAAKAKKAERMRLLWADSPERKKKLAAQNDRRWSAEARAAASRFWREWWHERKAHHG